MLKYQSHSNFNVVGLRYYIDFAGPKGMTTSIFWFWTLDYIDFADPKDLTTSIFWFWTLDYIDFSDPETWTTSIFWSWNMDYIDFLILNLQLPLTDDFDMYIYI